MGSALANPSRSLGFLAGQWLSFVLLASALSGSPSFSSLLFLFRFDAIFFFFFFFFHLGLSVFGGGHLYLDELFVDPISDAKGWKALADSIGCASLFFVTVFSLRSLNESLIGFYSERVISKTRVEKELFFEFLVVFSGRFLFQKIQTSRDAIGAADGAGMFDGAAPVPFVCDPRAKSVPLWDGRVKVVSRRSAFVPLFRSIALGFFVVVAVVVVVFVVVVSLWPTTAEKNKNDAIGTGLLPERVQVGETVSRRDLRPSTRVGVFSLEM